MVWEWRTETEGDCGLRIELMLAFAEVSTVERGEHVASSFPSEKQWLKVMVRPYQE